MEDTTEQDCWLTYGLGKPSEPQTHLVFFGYASMEELIRVNLRGQGEKFERSIRGHVIRRFYLGPEPKANPAQVGLYEWRRSDIVGFEDLGSLSDLIKEYRAKQ